MLQASCACRGGVCNACKHAHSARGRAVTWPPCRCFRRNPPLPGPPPQIGRRRVACYCCCCRRAPRQEPSTGGGVADVSILRTALSPNVDREPLVVDMRGGGASAQRQQVCHWCPSASLAHRAARVRRQPGFPPLPAASPPCSPAECYVKGEGHRAAADHRGDVVALVVDRAHHRGDEALHCALQPRLAQRRGWRAGRRAGGADGWGSGGLRCVSARAIALRPACKRALGRRRMHSFPVRRCACSPSVYASDVWSRVKGSGCTMHRLRHLQGVPAQGCARAWPGERGGGMGWGGAVGR